LPVRDRVGVGHAMHTFAIATSTELAGARRTAVARPTS